MTILTKKQIKECKTNESSELSLVLTAFCNLIEELYQLGINDDDIFKDLDICEDEEYFLNFIEEAIFEWCGKGILERQGVEVFKSLEDEILRRN